MKALAIYGAGHCVKVGMGFPGELRDKYPGRLWSVYGFFGAEGAREGKRVFGLGTDPAYLLVTGTPRASLPAADMLMALRGESLEDMLDAIVYYGDTTDVVVGADLKDLKSKYGAELERRNHLLEEALQLRR